MLCDMLSCAAPECQEPCPTTLYPASLLEVHLMARTPKLMPSSWPREMMVRASLRAGACTCLALTLLATPLPLRARYTEACAQHGCQGLLNV